MNCSVAQCLEVVGEWWSLLIVRDAFLGVSRFDEFQARLGISRNVLNQRLARLVDQGVFEKVAYQDHPPRYDYQLTKKGRDLWTVLTMMRQWGDKWAAPDGPPVELMHKSCAKHIKVIPMCSECGKPLKAGAVRSVVGPGARDPETILPHRTHREAAHA